MGRRRRKKNTSDSAEVPSRRLTPEVEARIEAWAQEAADAYDLALFDVVARPNWLLSVFVDHQGATEPGKGVSVDELADVSRYIEAFLDADEDVYQNYTLEVSSPGVERKLEKPRHFELSVGRDVRIVVHEPIDKQNVFEGRLAAFSDGVVTVQTGPDESVELDLANIAKARLTYDFSE